MQKFFHIYVLPSDADLPITWTVTTTDDPSPSKHVGGTSVNLIVLCMDVGTKELTVTAENDYGSAINSYTYECPELLSTLLYFPLVVKQ